MKLVLIILAFAVGCAHMPPAPTLGGVTMPLNFECWLHEHDDGTGHCLWNRGGQATEAQLAAMNAGAVVKLNLATMEGHDHLPPGVEIYDHPLSPVGPVGHDETVAILFDLQRATENLRPGTVGYLHCSHGVDRTGYIVAVYRVLVQHVLPSSAWAEWRRFPREVTDRLALYADFERETGFHIPEGER